MPEFRTRAAVIDGLTDTLACGPDPEDPRLAARRGRPPRAGPASGGVADPSATKLAHLSLSAPEVHVGEVAMSA